VNIIVTKTRVVLDRADYAGLLLYARKTRALAEELRDRLNQEHMLLRSALHELAAEKGKEPQYFSRCWLSAKRREADPVPIRRHPRGGEARRGA
jgi:hypothetical protein